LYDNSQFETLKNPEEHSVHCLVDVSVCYESPFNILIPPGEGSEYYTRGYYMTDNELLLSASRLAGMCSTCSDGSIQKGLRLLVTGVVQMDMLGDAGIMNHMLTPTAVSVATDDQVECMELVQVESLTAAPSMGDTTAGTMGVTASETVASS
jgi:hypothetical protein